VPNSICPRLLQVAWAREKPARWWQKEQKQLRPFASVFTLMLTRGVFEVGSLEGVEWATEPGCQRFDSYCVLRASCGSGAYSDKSRFLIFRGRLPDEPIEMGDNQCRQACHVDLLETLDRSTRLEHLVKTCNVSAATSRLVAPGRGILVCRKVARLG
jgi:hypothetical protein